MERIPEPELMDDPAQALAYARADFDAPHGHLTACYLERLTALGGLPSGARLADLGCGPGDITLRLAHHLPHVHIDGYDGAMPMIHLARAALLAEGTPQLWSRVHFHHVRLPDPNLPRHHYHALVSNSLLHHLADPMTLWQSLSHLGRPGAVVLISDLSRPDTPQQARTLVEQHAGSEDDLLKRDFYHSLLAAYRPEEVEDQLRRAGLGTLRCEPVSDRHLMISGRLPESHGK